jgi:ribosomal protection tetracycline resistance protein
LARRTLNLGILAHVDAGKTTLSERLLYAAGVITQVGSVDAGTTQTDTLALERQRGITIRSAVVSLSIAGTAVNLIDTPGHPDFIAEVDRVLGVLDGAVLVISAVEGVQPQTRVLMRALARLRVPTLVFVNKVDRAGADFERVLAEIVRRLPVTAVPMSSAHGQGTRAATVTERPDDGGLLDALTRTDEALLAMYVEDPAALTRKRLRAELAAQTAGARVHPVFAGSAVTGAGVDALIAGITGLLPAAAGDDEAPLSGRIFKIERGAAGEKVAYARLFAGTLRVRDRLAGVAQAEPSLGGAQRPQRNPAARDKVTAISVFDGGAWVRGEAVRAGEIAKLWGIGPLRVGDVIGAPRADDPSQQFASPMLEAVVQPREPGRGGALRTALVQLAEQDPLIDVHFDDLRHELSVSLYGEVQKEVIGATLAADYGIEVEFRETTALCIERPVRTGEAGDVLVNPDNPFSAGMALRVEPAPPGTGVDFRLAVDFRTIPLHLYRNVDEFRAAMAGYVERTLREGLYGWPVRDCVVTMFESDYRVADGQSLARRGPDSTTADFRKLTPMVLMRALDRARTRVCEPVARVRLDVPATTLGAVLGTLSRFGATVYGQSAHGDEVVVDAALTAADAQDLQRRLPGVTAGEGVLESTLGGYQPVRGAPPRRRRTTADPRNREQYLASLSKLLL